MLLKQVSFHNFRNFKQRAFSFNPFLTIIIGENARGKTNLLEAVYCLSNGEGFRETKEEELINFQSKEAMIEGGFVSGDEKTKFQVLFKKKEDKIVKDYLINKTQKKLFQYQEETLKTILFTPSQIEIIAGAPDRRREYFDRVISVIDIIYKKRLINYEHALTRRNKILSKVADEAKLKEELEFWNRYLEEQASYLVQKRESYTNFLNQNQELDDKQFFIRYLKNELTKKRLEDIFDKEKKYQKTLIGPQKDDFGIFLKNELEKNLHHFGSRSEQRLAIFWLKMNEIKYFEEEMKRKPILLLDDIFSELDDHNKKIVLNLIKKYQTIITTTDIEIFKLIESPKSIITL